MEVSRIQSCLEVLDPAVSALEGKVDVLESNRDRMDGKLLIIVWLVGVNVSLMIGLIITLFSWGLGHISLKAEFAQHPAQETADSPYAR